MDVTISLVAHNQLNDLKRLLPSLVTAAKHIDSEILLVDSMSSDGTSAFVNSNYSEVKTMYNSRKSGYGENHNLNLARTCGKYFVVMNCDMVVGEEVFSTLLNYMQMNPDIGILSPKILNEDGSIQCLNKRYPTIFDLFLRRFASKTIKSIFKKRLDRYEMHDVGYDRIYDVQFLSGSFMFCRTDILKSLNGFDEGYFLYFEDVDLCRRVQKTLRTVYYPYVSVIHFWHRDAHTSAKYMHYFIMSSLRYFNKWGYKIS